MELIGIKENFKKSYEDFTYRPSHFLGLIFLLVGLSIIPVCGYFTSLLYPGIYFCYLKLKQREDVKINDFFWAFQSFERFLKTFATIIMVFIAIMIGFVLLIIPGIYLMVLTVPCYYILVTEEVEFLEIFNRCQNLIKGHWWRTFRFLTFLTFFNIVGFLCLIVGMLFTGSISILMMINYFQNLNESKEMITEGSV